MKNLPLLLITLGGTLVLVLGIAFLFGRSNTPTAIDLTKLTVGARHIAEVFASEATISAEVTSTPTLVATDSAEATSEAKPIITVVEFSDFQCPACKAAASLKDEVLLQFPGQIKFIYRHFPLVSIHPNTLLAAEAAEAAGQFDKFWEYHDQLFATQEEWIDLPSDQAKQKFIEYAEKLDIEKDPFTQALDSDKVKSSVQSDLTLANELRLSYTPTFFVDGEEVPASEVISTINTKIQ